MRGQSSNNFPEPNRRYNKEEAKRRAHMIFEEFGGTIDLGENARGIGETLHKLRQLPIPVASQAGEKLDVYPLLQTEDNYEASWDYRVIGTSSGDVYFTLQMSLYNEEGELKPDVVPLEVIALGLKMALHHPADVDDQVYRNYHELIQEDALIECSHCQDKFITWSDAVKHENKVHKANLTLENSDPRPTISNYSG